MFIDSIRDRQHLFPSALDFVSFYFLIAPKECWTFENKNSFNMLRFLSMPIIDAQVHFFHS